MLYVPRPSYSKWLDPDLDFVSIFFKSFPTDQLPYDDRVELASAILGYMLENWRENR